MEETKTSGILIIAAGHPYYGRMAMNLAVSLKLADPEINISLAHAGNALKHIQNQYNLGDIFTQLIPIPEPYYAGRKNAEEWIRTKLHVYELSPYDETLFLDADMIWMKESPKRIFDALKDVEFSMNNNAVMDIDENGNTVADAFKYGSWIDIPEAIKKYKLASTKFFSLHSEMMYFKKSKNVKALFEKAIAIYNKPKVKPLEFAGALPDEFAFEIAIAETQLFPHTTPWRPVYWEMTENKFSTIPEVMKEGYFAYSMAGNNNNFWMIKQYNKYVKSLYLKANLHHSFEFKPKSSFLPERNKI